MRAVQNLGVDSLGELWYNKVRLKEGESTMTDRDLHDFIAIQCEELGTMSTVPSEGELDFFAELDS